MSKAIDETGNRYGHLLVLCRGNPKRTSSGNSVVMWKCRCDCGKEIEVRGTNLRSGHSTSCGCHHDKPIKQEQGKRYGKLTVISFDKIKDNIAYWICKCDCGNYTTVSGKDLRSGNTRSCGCIKSFREIEIQQLLQNNHISFQKEYSFSDLNNIDPLRFDFAIFNKNILIGLIEYNGEQHYLNKPMGWYTQERLSEIQYRDRLKIKYCYNNQIPLLILNKNNYNENIILEWINQIK